MSAHVGRTTVYLRPELVDDLRAEAARQNKPLSRLIQIAWKLSRERLRELRPPIEVRR